METNFEIFGTMLDCSRNAVLTVDSVKKWIDISKKLGLNTVMLYMEDTYEVDDNPFFGYFRGRYSQDELREIDKYALDNGISLIPCIQTLAHLNQIVRWNDYSPMVDTKDILLIGDDRVYELIDKMFYSISKCLSSKEINIGMDEAHMVGRGKYYDLHGDCDRSELLLEHIKKVAKIASKYGFKLTMWSDMFYRLAFGGNYYNTDAKFNESIKKEIPENVNLVYWDYYSTDKNHYDKMIKSHKMLDENTWFAGGLWSWIGFAPHNEFSMMVTKAAFESLKKNNVKNAFLTLWGDNGGECSKFSLLPSLFYASQIAKGITKKSEIKENFYKTFGIPFDKFLLLDLANGKIRNNPEKYLLYNDLFLGIFDKNITLDEPKIYQSLARKLSRYIDDKNFGYLFKSAKALCEVIAIKSTLGVRTRNAYESKNKEELKNLLADYKKLIKKLNAFYDAYKEQWFKENKPFGFEVQDIRLGGLIQRTKHCMSRIKDYIDGKEKSIPELEEKVLVHYKDKDGNPLTEMNYNHWAKNVSNNVI